MNKLKFRYQLAGLDRKWNYTQQTQIEYASLPPGSYEFKVYSIEKNNNESSAYASFKFTVLPMWWQTWIFRLVCVIVFAGFVLLLVQWRIRRIRSIEGEKITIMRQMGELKLEAIRSQLNPHFIFNSLNAIQGFLINHDPEAAREYLNDFSRVIRKSLQMSVNNFVPLKEEVALLATYLKLEQMRFEGSFDFSITTDGIETENIFVPALIFQHYTENAVKHGVRGLSYKGRISIKFTKENNRLRAIIEDNGKGIDFSKQSTDGSNTGMGLKLHNSRAELLEKIYNLRIDIKLSKKLQSIAHSSGTIVEIHLPLLNQFDVEKITI